MQFPEGLENTPFNMWTTKYFLYSVDFIKSHYATFDFFCKTEVCVNCGTHKRHNSKLITDSVVLGCVTLLQKWGHARMPQRWTHWMSPALLGLLTLLPTRKNTVIGRGINQQKVSNTITFSSFLSYQWSNRKMVWFWQSFSVTGSQPSQCFAVRNWVVSLTKPKTQT